MDRQEWHRKIREAQERTTYVIGGVSVARVRYGRETWRWARGPRRRCHDCGVINGEFHVPGCDMEQCRRCRGQLLSCECPYDVGDRPSEP